MLCERCGSTIDEFATSCNNCAFEHKKDYTVLTDISILKIPAEENSIKHANTCKEKSCRSEEIIYGLNNRCICKKCSTIFINDNYEISPVPYGGFSSRSHPECFTNYDKEDNICESICTSKKKCINLSPPKNYFNIIQEEFGAKNEKTCPNCGELDTGFFCSYCGSSLDAKANDNHITIGILKTVLSEWPSYFKTVTMAIFTPNKFFSGAFSKYSSVFFKETKTLDPIKFFLVNTTAVAIFSFLCNILFFNKEEGGNFFSDLVDLVLILAYMYIPGLVIGFFIARNLNSLKKHRKKELSQIGTTSTNNILRALIYTSPVEILATPVLLLLTEMSDSNNSLELDLFFPAIALAFLGKIISQFILFPYALKYACGIPKTAAQNAVTAFYSIPLILSNLLRLLNS